MGRPETRVEKFVYFLANVCFLVGTFLGTALSVDTTLQAGSELSEFLEISENFNARPTFSSGITIPESDFIWKPVAIMLNA